MNIKHKIVAVVALLFFITATNNQLPVFAEPIEPAQPTVSNATIEDTQLAKSLLENAIQNIQECDNKIEDNNNKLNKLKDQIAEQEKNIEDNEKEFKLAQDNVDEKDKQLSDRLKGIQMNGGLQSTPIQYLEVLFSSGDILDAAKRVALISQICTNDKKLISEAKESRKKVMEMKDNLQKGQKELQKNKDDMEIKHKELEDEKEKLLKYIEENKELLKNSDGDTVPVTLPSDISDKAKALIEEAEKYLKVPYLWGGESPEGFDCSGLMQYVFKSQGIDIDRTSQEQQKNAKAISMSDIKPGDLVFNKESEATHVGMYIGNDMYIQAPHTGDVVKISKLSTSNMKYVGRVLN